ncbi:MAG: hypothetical protein AAEJ43_11820, partial [Gammaproteobacteria bacterium]
QIGFASSLALTLRARYARPILFPTNLSRYDVSARLVLRASCPSPFQGQRRFATLFKIASGDFVSQHEPGANY